MSNFFEEAGNFIWETAKIVVVSLLIILPIRYFIVQPFFVRGESMQPSFNDKDYLIIDELSYRFDAPGRGEVIVFRFPQDPSQYYIKRIIGLPEETIEIKNGEIKIKLDDNEYFVLGDNRDASSDSRRWGPLAKHLIIGRAWLRIWPFNEAHAIKAPAY